MSDAQQKFKFSTFYLKGVLYDFSLAHTNEQHHYSWALGPLLNKINVI
jgi:hypothetical protein